MKPFLCLIRNGNDSPFPQPILLSLFHSLTVSPNPSLSVSLPSHYSSLYLPPFLSFPSFLSASLSLYLCFIVILSLSLPSPIFHLPLSFYVFLFLCLSLSLFLFLLHCFAFSNSIICSLNLPSSLTLSHTRLPYQIENDPNNFPD